VGAAPAILLGLGALAAGALVLHLTATERLEPQTQAVAVVVVAGLVALAWAGAAVLA
jgi:uncharacterized membrane protein